MTFNLSPNSLRIKHERNVQCVSFYVTTKADGTLLTYEINAYRYDVARDFVEDDITWRRVGHRSAVEPHMHLMTAFANDVVKTP